MPLCGEAEPGECRGKAHDKPLAGRESDAEARARSGKLHKEGASPARIGRGFAPQAHHSFFNKHKSSVKPNLHAEVVFQCRLFLCSRYFSNFNVMHIFILNFF